MVSLREPIPEEVQRNRQRRENGKDQKTTQVKRTLPQGKNQMGEEAFLVERRGFCTHTRTITIEKENGPL